ncbi:MAG: 3-deoxy-7-phosphoheptulonate synthase, partial [Novosphingobium sp.]
MASNWTPTGWTAHEARHLPAYPDAAALGAVTDTLSRFPPLVFAGEARALKADLAEVAQGKGFLLQGGDCAESFDDPVAEQVAGIVGLFDAMAERLKPACRGPLIEIARIAGQFAKPRSATAETHDGVTLPAYRGDIVNGIGFVAHERKSDPQRMIRAHMQSVGTAASLAATRDAIAPIFTSHEALLLPYEEALTRRDAAGRWWAASGHMLWLGDRTRQV